MDRTVAHATRAYECNTRANDRWRVVCNNMYNDNHGQQPKQPEERKARRLARLFRIVCDTARYKPNASHLCLSGTLRFSCFEIGHENPRDEMHVCAGRNAKRRARPLPRLPIVRGARARLHARARTRAHTHTRTGKHARVDTSDHATRAYECNTRANDP